MSLVLYVMIGAAVGGIVSAMIAIWLDRRHTSKTDRETDHLNEQIDMLTHAKHREYQLKAKSIAKSAVEDQRK